MSATLPTADQEQRARWDLLLTDLEYRMEQLRLIKSPTPIDLMMLDVEMRTEQLRQIKATPTRITVMQLAVSSITAAVALIGGISGGTVWLLHLLGHL